MSRTSSVVSSVTARYRNVVSRFECPSHFCIFRAFAPLASRSVAKFLRNLCRIHFLANRSVGARDRLPVFLTDTLRAVQPTIESRPLQSPKFARTRDRFRIRLVCGYASGKDRGFRYCCDGGKDRLMI